MFPFCNKTILDIVYTKFCQAYQSSKLAKLIITEYTKKCEQKNMDPVRNLLLLMLLTG